MAEKIDRNATIVVTYLIPGRQIAPRPVSGKKQKNLWNKYVQIQKLKKQGLPLQPWQEKVIDIIENRRVRYHKALYVETLRPEAVAYALDESLEGKPYKMTADEWFNIPDRDRLESIIRYRHPEVLKVQSIEIFV